MSRFCLVALTILILMHIIQPSSMYAASGGTPLAISVTERGIVTITDAELLAANWPTPLPRERITLMHRGEVLPLTDTGSGFAFLALTNESPWSEETVYWLSIGESIAPRTALPSRLSTPLVWETDRLYERHHQSARGDSWWAGELRGDQAVSAALTLPETISSNTPLQISLRATAIGTHSIKVQADGQQIGQVMWSDPPTGTQVVTGTVMLPAHSAGLLRIDLALLSTDDTVLVDRLTLPTVFPPALPITHHPLRTAVTVPPEAAGADLLIITHSAFQSALDPLVAAHGKRGERAVVVDVQAAYDRFSGGEREPEAIRSLIRELRPGAVLLVGAGSVALREVVPTRPVFIPPYLIVDAQSGETACDTCYTRLNDGPVAAQPLPDIPIGRLPVTTLVETQTVVAKTVTMLLAPPVGAWRSHALVLADNDTQADGTSDAAGSFTATAETGLSVVPQGMSLTRLYYAPNLSAARGPYEPNTARLRCHMFRALDGGSSTDNACPQIDASQSGVALWVYVGHGSPWQWAVTEPNAPTPYLWYLYDADARRNGERLPILLSMTCLSSDVANPILQSNDERLVLKANGGVIASLGSAGEGVNTGHALLLRGVLARLYAAERKHTIGEAHLAGLQALRGASPDLAFAFSLLGDPLLTAPFVPSYSASLPLVTR